MDANSTPKTNRRGKAFDPRRLWHGAKWFVVDSNHTVLLGFRNCLPEEAVAYTKQLKPELNSFRLIPFRKLTKGKLKAAKLLPLMTPAQCAKRGITLDPKYSLRRAKLIQKALAAKGAL